MPEDRISRLSQRFRTHATGRRPSSTRTRERQSLYLDIDLVKRIDKTHKALSHELYPARVGKSDVLEALLEYGLEHLAEIKAQLGQEPEADGASSQ